MSRAPTPNVATEPSRLARRDVGTPVFGGILTASFIRIFAIPALYVIFQSIRERLRSSARPVELREKQAIIADRPGEMASERLFVRIKRWRPAVVLCTVVSEVAASAAVDNFVHHNADEPADRIESGLMSAKYVRCPSCLRRY
jgi:hypothetical protein